MSRGHEGIQTLPGTWGPLGTTQPPGTPEEAYPSTVGIRPLWRGIGHPLEGPKEGWNQGISPARTW